MKKKEYYLDFFPYKHENFEDELMLPIDKILDKGFSNI